MLYIYIYINIYIYIHICIAGILFPLSLLTTSQLSGPGHMLLRSVFDSPVFMIDALQVTKRFAGDCGMVQGSGAALIVTPVTIDSITRVLAIHSQKTFCSESFLRIPKMNQRTRAGKTSQCHSEVYLSYCSYARSSGPHDWKKSLAYTCRLQNINQLNPKPCNVQAHVQAK